jgi:hypothetical protein
VYESTHTDPEMLAPGEGYYYSVRTLGRSGEIAGECVY